MIVVGFLAPPDPWDDAVLGIARRTAEAERRTEVAGAIPAGAEGDRLLLELAGTGVGHATVQRTSAQLEPADVDLALRYLPDVRAVVLVRPPAGILPAAAAATAWSGATLVLVDEAEPPEDLPVEPIALEPPDSDADGTFAGFVAALAVRLDQGVPPRRAWDETVGMLAADRM